MSQYFDTILNTLTEKKPGRHHALKAIGGLLFVLVVLLSALVLAPQVNHPSTVTAATTRSYTFTVNTTVDSHDFHWGDGKCADKKGRCSLRAALEEADALPNGSSITITVPSGTYGLRLGGLGLAAYRTITVTGASSKTTFINGNKRSTVVLNFSNASLSQLTIEEGSAPNNNSLGGGIANYGTLSLTNSILRGNSAYSKHCSCGGFGGGIANFGTLTVTNSSISGNSAANYGGGIANNGTATVINSTINGNLTCCTSGFGGGIYNGFFKGNSATLTVISSTIRGNEAYFGGGILNDSSSTLAVNTSTFSANEALYNSGGIANYGTLTVSTSAFIGNSAPNGSGGGIVNGSGTLSVTTSTFSGNSASTGGGIANYDTLTVANSTFSGNSATTGGGIANSGTLSVANSTFSGNSAHYGSGGSIDNSSGTATLTGTILANTPTGSNCSGTITEGVGYNLDSGTSCGFSLSTDLTNTDPLLGPLGHHGGPTQTMALLQGSKAIDWVAASSCPATDQRGYMRPDHGEPTCDIGAYESSY